MEVPAAAGGAAAPPSASPERCPQPLLSPAKGSLSSTPPRRQGGRGVGCEIGDLQQQRVSYPSPGSGRRQGTGWALGDQGVVDAGPLHWWQQLWEAADFVPPPAEPPENRASPKRPSGPSARHQSPPCFLPSLSPQLWLDMASPASPAPSMGGDLGAACPRFGGSSSRMQRATDPPSCWQCVTPTSSLTLRQLGCPPVPGVVTLPSTTGGVLLVGGASGVLVGGKRTLKSQNWDVGCRSSDSVSNATPAPLLPMASSTGILRTSPSQTAFSIFYAGPAKRHPGCRGGESRRGWPWWGGGTGRAEGLAFAAMPCPAKAAQRCPRARPASRALPRVPAELAHNFSSFPPLVPRCPSTVCWWCGCCVLLHAPHAQGDPQSCPGLPRAACSLPADTAPLCSARPWQGGLALPCGRVHLKPLEEHIRAGTDEDTAGQPLVLHPPAPPRALPLPGLSHAASPQQALGPGTLQLPATAGSWSLWVPSRHQPHLGGSPCSPHPARAGLQEAWPPPGTGDPWGVGGTRRKQGDPSWQCWRDTGWKGLGFGGVRKS